MEKEKLVEAVKQSVREGVSSGLWRRYRKYRIEPDESGDVWAAIDPPPRWRGGSSEDERESVSEVSLKLYAPLTDAPDLFIRFARLEPTREAWRSFIHGYGTLGRDPTRDRLSLFVEEVQRAKRVLKLYEAATAGPADVKTIAGIMGEGGAMSDHDRWAKRTTPPEASLLALKEVDAVTRRMLGAETFTDLYRGSHGEQPLLSYGFHSLLGAIWLQFAFLRTSIREPRRCAAEDCSGLLTASAGGKKALYKNKDYCDKACGQRKRDRDKKWSRTLSRGDTT